MLLRMYERVGLFIVDCVSGAAAGDRKGGQASVPTNNGMDDALPGKVEFPIGVRVRMRNAPLDV